MGDERNQLIKADKGKPEIHLVPTEIIRNIAAIRSFGVEKYGTAESWRSVEVVRYIDALDRHVLLFNENPTGIDEESGMPHLWHVACNVAFLCELMKGEWNKPDKSAEEKTPSKVRFSVQRSKDIEDFIKEIKDKGWKYLNTAGLTTK